MKNTNDSFSRQLAAGALIACFAAHPALAATTNISPTPLATGSADSILPNVLFTLDDSGSMDWDYLPDYVNDNGKCMTTSTGGTSCLASDPPYASGGQFGFNGVGYDPNVFYAPGVKVDGTSVLTAPLDILNLQEDAYDTSGTPSTVDLTADIDQRRFCTSAGACKRNGADSAGALVSGTDAFGNAMAAGQFPYRTNASNSSATIFGLPEMMSIGSFTRSGSTVTVTTVEAHGLTTSDKVYVPTTTSNLNVNCVAITGTTTNTFTYTSGSSGTVGATNGSYRKCVSATWTRSGSTVTVTSANHGLQTNDQIRIDSSDNNQDKLTSAATVTVTGSNTFTYAGSSSGGITSGTAVWVRSELYNVVQTTSGGPIAYRITPLEYCSDANLTTCTLAATPGTAPAGFPFPAYVRFCKTQAEAYAPGLVTGASGSPATSRCQAKFINSLGLSYTFPRLGRFSRENLTTGGSYLNRPNRSDCAAVPTCTGTEEMQNYARWYTYYRTRMQMMKTAAGRAFLSFIGSPTSTPPRPNSMRLGFITIHAADSGSVSSSKYLKILDFDTTHANNFYTKFYSISPGGGTPLQQALSRAGWIFAGKLGSGLTSGIPAADDPMQSSCQRNFSIFTTDGYWNGALGKTISNGAIGNRDNVNPTIVAPYTSPMVDRATTVTYDGSPNTSIRTITTDVETQTICGQGLPDQCGCTKSGRKRIRDIIDSTVRKIITTDGVVTSDTTTNSSTSSTIGSCSSSSPTFTIPDDGSGNHTQTTSTDVTQPAASASSDTLADVAMYYYMTDLRGGTDFAGNATGPSTSPNAVPAGSDVGTNNVPAKSGARDFATHQHMVTFTLGLADGYMRYQPDYDTSPTGSFADIKNAAAGACFWAGSATCNWPVPTADDPSTLDDLWHAAVNGRGQFFQALNATDLTLGLANALTALNAQVASAAASATSSPNVTQTDNQIFSTTYETNTWSGKVFSQTIDIATGTVNPTIQWQADERLLTQVGPVTDTRRIFTFNPVAGNVMDFTFPNITANASGGEANWFQNKCTPALQLSQCSGNPVLDSLTNNGDNMVNFLRGQTGLEGSAFRDRIVIDPLTNVATQSVLGDTISAKPAFVRNPTFSYSDLVTPDYASFKSAQATRAPRVYVGANDGYLHAFDGNTGDEVWAYAPRFLLAGMYQLADKQYGTRHTYFVDGSPETGDVFDGVSWRTILVGGASGGGRGFYALDITNPTTPRALWEFCSDAAVCNNSAAGLRNDPDLGFSYGNPIIGKRAYDGKWVVVLTSGLNNVPGMGGLTGDGLGYFYVLDAITGALLNKVSTGAGSVVTPSGLMKTSAFFDTALTDATFRYVYGGDQLGNVWRLDLSTATPTLLHIASLKDGAGRAQPITTRPALTHIGLDRVLFFGTGRYIGTADLSDPGLASGIAFQQSLYAIKDKDSDYGFSSLRAVANLVQRTFTLISPTERGIAAGAPLDWSTGDGWFIDFNPPVDPTPGERVNIDPRLILGTLAVVTNIPTVGTGACTVGGTSKIYGFDFRNGTAIASAAGGVVGRSLGGTIAVGMAVVQLPSGAIKDIVTGADTSKTTVDVEINSAAAGVKRFSYRER